MPWVQVEGDRIYCDSVVSARAYAAKVLEAVHSVYAGSKKGYSPNKGIAVYPKARSKNPLGCVRYYMGKPGILEWVKYDGQYGTSISIMHKNGKLR